MNITYVYLLLYIPRNNFDDEIKTIGIFSSLESLLRDNPNTPEYNEESTDGLFWDKWEVQN